MHKPHVGATERLADLRAAFETLIGRTERLGFLPEQVTGSGEITLRMVGEHSPEVILRIRVDGADLTARSDPDESSVGTTVIHDQLTVDLSDGFKWNDAACDSAGELAHLLFKHMSRRLDAAAGLGVDH